MSAEAGDRDSDRAVRPKIDRDLNENGSLHVFDQENGAGTPPRPDVFHRQDHLTQPERVGGILPLDGD